MIVKQYMNTFRVTVDCPHVFENTSEYDFFPLCGASTLHTMIACPYAFRIPIDLELLLRQVDLATVTNAINADRRKEEAK
jgi:hypothetical protein